MSERAKAAILWIAGAICFAVILDRWFVRNMVPGEDARLAAIAWLKLIDKEDYGASWDQASESFRNGVSRESWIAELDRVRRPLGKLKSRRLAGGKFQQEGEAHYDILHFRSSFEYRPLITERVVPQLETDRKWRVSGYFLRTGEDQPPLLGH